MDDYSNELNSKYLGQLKRSATANWKFERPLVLSAFKNFNIPVIFTKYFVEEYPSLVNDIDNFVEKLLFKDQSATLAETVENSLYGLLLEKFIYRFNFEKGQYELFIPSIDKSKIWDSLSFSLNIIVNEDTSEFVYMIEADFVYMVEAKYQSFRSVQLRDDVKLIFNQNSEMIYRASGDEVLLNVPTQLLPLTGQYYFNEKDDLWRSCELLSLLSWDGYPIRSEFYASDKSKLNESEIDQLFWAFSQRTKKERTHNDSAQLQNLLKIYLEDYSIEDEEYPFLINGKNSIDDLWLLVSPPTYLSIISDGNGAIYLAVFHDCLWDDEHGMHFIYDKDLTLVKVDQGSDPYI